jgi:transcriptional regulator
VYTPRLFSPPDRALALELIEANGFATLISWPEAGPQVSHIPLILDRDEAGEERILGHVARANPHWHAFDGRSPAVAIFHGPHGYVSPAWYATHPSVPTWNYAVVHAHGIPAVVDDNATHDILRRLIDQYEVHRARRWTPDLSPEFIADDLKAIVGFQMPVDRLEAKFKLSQNKDAADREGALAGLESEGGSQAALAAFARSYFERTGPTSR